MKRSGLWTRSYTTLIAATIAGAVGNIAGSFALSFLVYEETASTLASALVVAIRVVPGFFIPLFLSPVMDRLPRKPFLVGCDVLAGAAMFVCGLWLRSHAFGYLPYLGFSLGLAAIGSLDSLTYNAFFPMLIPKGCEEKGYTVSSMLYPTLTVIMTPLSAVLYRTVGVPGILMGQGVLSAAAAAIESTIPIVETVREGTAFSLRQWADDLKEAGRYLKKEKGILAFDVYSAVTNGMYCGYEPVLVAFFTTMPGFTMAMYSFFTVAEFAGRTVGGALMYAKERPKEKKYGFCLFVYLLYDVMDGILLWLPYPLMLANRAVCGFLGIQSGTMRSAAVQAYIPNEMRARVNAFESILLDITGALLAVAVGALGELLPLKWVMTVCAASEIVVIFLMIVRRRPYIERIYMREPEAETK